MATPFDALTAIPCSLTSGEQVSWTESASTYPIADYKLTYEFSGQTPQDGFQKFDIAGSESGDTYTFTFPLAPKPGVYHWQKRVTKTSDNNKRVLCRGQIIIRPNLAVEPTVTAAAAQLVSLNTAIASLSANPDRSVSFNGQSFTREDLRALQDARTRLQAEVYREQQGIAALTGDEDSHVYGTRFARSGCGYGGWR